MSLQLEFDIKNPVLSTTDYLKISFTLTNLASSSYTIPGPQDQTECLTIDVYTADNVLFRRINGISLQHMLTSARVDRIHDLDLLHPGEKWEWQLDLSSYHYPLSVGKYNIAVSYNYQQANIALSCSGQTVEVVRSPIAEFICYRSNPVLDGLTLLTKHSSDNVKPVYKLRLQNYTRPLVAWYSATLPVSDNVEQIICASPDFFKPDTFNHFFQQKLIWKFADSLYIQHYDRSEEHHV